MAEKYTPWKPSPISDDEWAEIKKPIRQSNVGNTANKVSKQKAASWKPSPIGDDEWNEIKGSMDIKPVKPTVDKSASDFIPGVKRGIDTLQASGYGATAIVGNLAEKAGFEDAGQAMQDWGIEGYQRNIEEAGENPNKYSFKDVYTGKAGVGGAIDWMQGTLGELAPSMAEAALGAVAGSFAAPGAGTAIGGLAGRTILRKGIDKLVKEGMEKGVGDLTEAQLRKQVTGQALKKLGGKVGMGAAVMPMESGHMYAGLLEEHGIDAPETALLFGGLATSLEFFGGNSKLVDVFVDSLAKGSTGLAKKSAKEILSNIPQEALQEGGQEVMSILNTVANTDEKFLTAENVEQIIESMGAGAVGGGAGAFANVVMSGQERNANITESNEGTIEETNTRIDNIFSNGKEFVDSLEKETQTGLRENQSLLNDYQKIDQLAEQQNVKPEEVIVQVIDAIDEQKRLLSNIQAKRKKENLTAKKEFEKLSPKEKTVKQTIDRLNKERQKANKAAYDEELAPVTKMRQELDQVLQDELIDNQIDSQTSLADQTAARNRQQRFEALKRYQEENNITDPEVIERQRRFEELKIQDEERRANARQQEQDRQVAENLAGFEERKVFGREPGTQSKQEVYEGLFGRPGTKSAEESAKVFEEQMDSVMQEADYDTRQRMYEELFAGFEPKSARESAVVIEEQQDVNAEQQAELKRVLDPVIQERNPAIRQEMYNKLFMRPGRKDAQESAQVFEETDYRREGDIINTNNKPYKVISPLIKRLDSLPNPENYEIVETPDGFVGRLILGAEPRTFTREQRGYNPPPFFETSNRETTNQVTIESVENIFPGQQVTQDENGTINVKFKNGKGLKINSIQDAGQGYIEMAVESGQLKEGQSILGVTVGNNILLDENFADNATLWHENKHVLDNLGMITEADNSLLNQEFNKLRKVGKLNFQLSTHKDPKQRMVENRANTFAQIMTEREAYRNKPLGKVIQRVMDFFNQLLALGKQTVGSFAQEVESGKIYERQVDGQTFQTTVPQFEETANKWYSTLENAVDGFQQKQATPDQWKGMIKNYPVIKQEELDWMGLNEWLDEQGGKVSKEELINYVQANRVNVEEVVKGNINNNALYKVLGEANDMLEPYDFIIRLADNQLVLVSYEGYTISTKDIDKAPIPQEVKDIFYFTKSELPKILDAPRYPNQTLLGGKNYKELLLTLPPGQKMSDREKAIAFLRSKNIFFNENKDDVLALAEEHYDEYFDKDFNAYGDGVYQPDHWNEPNVLAHIRFNERTDANGNKVLFIEEVQSDWHQAGRKEGYQQLDQKKITKLPDNYKIHEDTAGYYIVKSPEGNSISSAHLTESSAIFDAINKLNNVNAVPDAPYKKSWPLLALKRMVRYAAENGFDKIAWPSTPEQIAQIEGWGEIRKEGDSYFIAGDKNVTAIVNRYLQDIPRMLNKEFNRGKWGKAKVNKTNIPSTKKYYVDEVSGGYAVYSQEQSARLGTFESKKEAQSYIDTELDNQSNQFSLPITQRMKSKAINEGMPLFQIAEDATEHTATANQEFQKLGSREFIKKHGSRELKASYFALEEILPEGTLESVNIEVDPGQHPTGSLGEYLPRNRLVRLYNTDSKGNNVSYEMFAATMLHEIVHAKTYHQLQYEPKIRTELSLLRDKIAAQLLSSSELVIYNTYRDNPRQYNNFIFDSRMGGETYQDLGIGNQERARLIYTLISNDELLANATHPSMQRALNNVSVEYKQSFMDTIKSIFQRLFGWTNQQYTAYEQVMSAIGRLNKEYEIEFDSESVESLQDLSSAEAPDQSIPQAQYDRLTKRKNDLIKKTLQTVRIRSHETKLWIDKALGSVSTRLKNVSPMLSAKIRTLDYNTSQKIVKALHTALPLLNANKRMSAEDKIMWDWARKNSDEGKIEQLSQKYNLSNDLVELRSVLDNIRQEAIEVGYDVGFIDEYWPRVLKDQEGFLQATQGISERPEFTEAIRDKAKSMGLTQEVFERKFPEVKADIISNMILGRHYGIGGPGNIQGRVFEEIPEEYADFYMDSDAALMQYIYSMTKKIEARKFFGKVPTKISQLKTKRNKKQSDLIKYQQLADQASVDNPEMMNEYKDQIKELNEDLTLIEQDLAEYKFKNDYTENIGTYIDDLRKTGEIKLADERVVKDILTARFNEHGTIGVWNAYKNLAYIDTMGSPISALTQIGDMAWAMYFGKVWTPRGFSNTVKNTMNAVIGKSGVTKEDLGIERIAQEFADGTTLGNAVSKVFKMVGLEKIDSIGKEVLVNNALDLYKSQVKTKEGIERLKKEIRPIFGKETDSVIEDLLSDNPDRNASENVKLLLYHKLLDFQPVALSEMPEFYLTGGDKRVFYMLKTYTLKQFDVFRREAWHNLKSKDPQQKLTGIGNLVKLMSILTLANAGADELKDFLLGKETKFEDHVIENFLTMGGASRYVRMQMTQDGIGSTLGSQILPPFKFINNLGKDILEGYNSYVAGDTMDFDHLRIINSIPSFGLPQYGLYGVASPKLYYWHYGRGSEFKKSINEQEFSEVRKEMRLFNKQLENADDKRAFLSGHSDMLVKRQVYENFNNSVNRIQATINKLEKLDETPNVLKRIGQLKDRKEQILDRYFEVADRVVNQ